MSTSQYGEEARLRLGDAVTKARLAAGYKFRTDFARAADITSIRSMNMLENGQAGVGQSILFAVGRALPNWTEDTPKIILEGGPIPPTVAEMPEQRYPPELYSKADEDLDERERAILAVKGMSDEGKWLVIFGLREQEYGQARGRNRRERP